MFQERCYDRDMNVNNTFFAENMSNNIDMETNMNSGFMPMASSGFEQGSVASPMVEPLQERCVHRTIMHEVPHVCPLRTRIINHHVYRHTYRPEYSCCEENVVSNVNEGSCCNFR